MKVTVAFIQKEFLELLRSGRLILMLIIFAMFGIMNPAIAKLTPWMYEMLSDSMEKEGIIVKNVAVNALTSWNQFYKNISMVLIIFVLMLGGILVNEYQKGTLIPVITKGLSRYQVLLAKFLTVLICWSGVYWLCYGITYGYNAYFWDNSVAHHVAEGGLCIYFFGCWIISLMMLASVLVNQATGVLLMTGGVVVVFYIVSLFPYTEKYLPLRLMGAGSLLAGTTKSSDYGIAIFVTLGLFVLQMCGAVILIRKRQMSVN